MSDDNNIKKRSRSAIPSNSHSCSPTSRDNRRYQNNYDEHWAHHQNTDQHRSYHHHNRHVDSNYHGYSTNRESYNTNSTWNHRRNQYPQGPPSRNYLPKNHPHSTIYSQYDDIDPNIYRYEFRFFHDLLFLFIFKF